MDSSAIKRTWWAMGLALFLAGCADSHGYKPGYPAMYKTLPDRVEINSVPFFRGQAFQSGPNALASMLTVHGVQTTPGLLEKPLKLPGAEEKLDQNMSNLAREYGFVVYPVDHQFTDLLAQVAAGYPVLLRFSEGSMWWKDQRYGVLVGFNQNKRTVLIYTGLGRLTVSFDEFTSDWNNAGNWAVLVQSPRQLPTPVDRDRWLKAANDLAQAGQEQAAGEAVKAINNAR
ncbi:cysteine peptidase family C39 domain-containing protein [Pseudomonas putida]|uniref:cysteine peptidase family C39 domain-containing protein n=1 Tax=Pseudomonas putida TaxID=303 RepID=UPI002364815A|nr:cysteine peptidase family C39 domain-containing protein [Pseudomonas putida]MDD1963895.1 cysteine peptidase family C39 domain-containing protein [Pseudomonas putida]